MDHLNEPAEAGRIQRRELVAAEQTKRVAPVVEDLDELDSVVLEAIEFLLERMKRTKNNKEFFATMAQG